MRSKARVALVTGAGGQIGRAIVRALSEEHAVVATDVRLPVRMAGAAMTAAMDVTNEEDVRLVRNQVYERFRHLDLLVYSAGVLREGRILSSGQEHWRKVFEVNAFGAARCLRAFGELMARQRSGRVIVIGSTSAVRGLKGAAAYAASKAALESLIRTAALELASYGVSAVALSVGYVNTQMTRKLRPQTLAGIPLGRACTPDEVAEVVAALARLKTPYLTGVSVPLDGGLSAQ